MTSGWQGKIVTLYFPAIVAGYVAGSLATFLPFRISGLKQANYEFVAYAVSVAGLAYAVIAVFGLVNDGYDVRYIELLVNCGGLVFGAFGAVKAVPQAATV